MSEQALPGEAWTAVGFLTAQHRQVEGLWERLEGSAGILPDGRRLALGRDIVSQLSRHAGIEEQLLYPSVRDCLADGGRLADRSLQEHRELARRLSRLDGLGPEEPGFERQFAQLMAEVRHHVVEEEGEVFPRLERTVSPVKLAKLAGQMELAAGLAPTRPHPRAPQTPPANRLTGPAAGILDRIRDVVRSRPEGDGADPTPDP